MTSRLLAGQGERSQRPLPSRIHRASGAPASPHIADFGCDHFLAVRITRDDVSPRAFSPYSVSDRLRILTDSKRFAAWLSAQGRKAKSLTALRLESSHPFLQLV